MSDNISFRDDISALEAELEAAREELAALEERWRTYDLKTQDFRQSLRSLRQTLRGQLPEEPEGTGTQVIEAVDVNPDTGRPPRGARRAQIEQICRQIGRKKEVFRTVEVLHILEDVEGDLTDGMKSYTYAVMGDLDEEGLVEKVGRGRWSLTP